MLYVEGNGERAYWQMWQMASRVFVPEGKLSLIITPPDYTNLPVLTLADPTKDLPQGIKVHLSAGSTLAIVTNGEGPYRLYVNNDWLDLPEATAALTTAYQQGAHLAVRRGPWLVGYWPVVEMADKPPKVTIKNTPEALSPDQVKILADVSDDFGLKELQLKVYVQDQKEAVETVRLQLPSDGQSATEIVTDLGDHPLAGQKVSLRLRALDNMGQESVTEAVDVLMPDRQFTQPLASKISEIRQLLLGPTPNRETAAGEMLQLATNPQLYGGDEVMLLALRSGAVRLILNPDHASLQAVSRLLWQMAMHAEQGRRTRAAWRGE